jgi:hypothetical protein
MDKLYLTLEMPPLDGETAASIQAFLYALIDAFDAQYCYSIERYYSELRRTLILLNKPNDQDPF